MRAAPAVELAIHRRGVWLGFAALLSGISAAALGAWLAQQSGLAHAGTVACLAFVAAAVPVWRFTPIDTGVLRWDGGQWQFAGQSGDVRVVFDLGPWLLVLFDARDTRQRAWLAIGERAAGSGWAALRAAVYSRRSNRDDRDNASATRM